jgi:hypothetical protein
MKLAVPIGGRYIGFEDGKWQTELARELRAAGIPFDLSKVF